MADRLFENQRLADVYDLFDSAERPDLDLYIAMVDEFNAHTVIDLGCGTGNLACRLAAIGKKVIGVDPASASLNVANRKTYADQVDWFHGTVDILPNLQTDLITMTGNVAQVFVTDNEWIATLMKCRSMIKPGGRLVFEVRDPEKEAWKNWKREHTYKMIDVPKIGKVESWVDLLDVQLPFVTFRHTFIFHNDGKVLTSESTLIFRSKTEIIDSLLKTNFLLEDIRDAPDRPGLEHVFIARSPEFCD